MRHIVGSTSGSPLERARRVAAVARSGARLGDELVGLRCDRGAQILQLLSFPDATVVAMASADEHWDGRGKPAGLRGEEISLLDRLVGLAQTAEIFFAAGGPQAAADVVRRRRGTWFDPALVRLFEHVAADSAFWLLRAVSRSDVERRDQLVVGEAVSLRPGHELAHRNPPGAGARRELDLGVGREQRRQPVPGGRRGAEVAADGPAVADLGRPHRAGMRSPAQAGGRRARRSAART